jgi:tetratricopeptide (TPR) repeat protein
MDVNAKNVGAAGNIEHLEQHNYFGDKQVKPLPSSILSAKGFVGREDELKKLRESYGRGARAIVLHGMGGVGKTELARRFVEDIKADYQAFVEVDMQGLTNPLTPKDAMLSVIRAFDPEVNANLSGADVEGLYVSLLNQHKTVVFLDNAKDRNQVEQLSVSKNSLLIVTSRENFTLTGGKDNTIGAMPLKDAKDLLFSVADEARFEGKEEELAHLAGYLPIALLPLASILAEDVTEDVSGLIQKYRILQLRDPNRENLSVEASFDLSYERLSDELKKRWRELAVSPSDFVAEAAKAVWQGENARESLAVLVKSNLISFDPEKKRYRMHDLARDYTRGKLNVEELYQAEKFHAAYYGDLLAKFDAVSLENLAIFDLERTNIKRGFEWVQDKVEVSDEVIHICYEYTGYTLANEILLLRLHRREYIKWIEAGLTASRKMGDRQAESNHLSNLGYAYDDLGEYKKAIEYYEQSLAISREIGDPRDESSGLGNLGVVYRNLGEYETAIQYDEEALKMARETGDRQLEGMWLGNLGNAHASLGDYKKAMEYSEQALVIARETGDRQREGMWLGNLGSSSSNLGEHKKAIEYNEAALAIAREIGDRQREGMWIGNLGSAYADLEETEKAIGLWKEAVQILEEVESPNAEFFRRNLAIYQEKENG